MSLPRALSRSTGAALACFTVLAGLLVVTPARAAAPAYTLEERAQAIAQPSLVFLEMLASGVVREKASGTVLSTAPITVSARCSGFVVNSTGQAVTIRSCVSPTTARLSRWAYEELADQQVKAGKLASKDVNAYISNLVKNAAFTADAPGTTPVRRVFAQTSTTASAGLSAAPAIEADVVDQTTNGDAGVAIVKISQAGLPAVELATSPTPPDSKLLAIGYASSGGGNFAPKVQPIKITGVWTGLDASAFTIDAKLPSQNRGGLAVDLSGRAVGLFLPNEDGDIRVMVDAPDIAAQLDTAGVARGLSDSDRQFRAGLDDYFGGHYAAAIEKLSAVVTATPGNRVAEQYRKLAQDRQTIEGEANTTPTWTIVLLSALGGAILVAVAAVAFFARQRRNRRQAVADEILMPLSVNPFAPTSGMPSSGAGGYPVSGGNLTYPGYGPPVALEIPQPAPPGVPLPQPPVARAPEPPVPAPAPAAEDAAAAQPEPVAQPSTEEPGEPDWHSLPAPPIAGGPAAPAVETPTQQLPTFSWPEDDDSAPGSQYDANPWSPQKRPSGDQ